MNNIELYGFVQGAWHRTEIVTNGDNKTIYCGKCAAISGAENTPAWCIKRITITNNNNIQTIVEQFADGNMRFDNVWADRANLTYKYNN